MSTIRMTPRISDFRRQVNRANRAMMKNADTMTYQVAKMVRDVATSRTPKDTGNMSRSYRIKRTRTGSDTHYTVINVSKYFSYVEFGTGIYALSGGRSTPWWYRHARYGMTKTQGQRPKLMMMTAYYSVAQALPFVVARTARTLWR